MESARDVLGYMLGLAFCLAALLLSAIAWFGLEASFGWRWALGMVVACMMMRLNIAVFVGLYFYANGVFGWPMADSIGFAIPGLLLITPGIAVGVFTLLVGTPVRR